MEDSTFWLGWASALIVLATLAIMFPDALRTEPMYIEMLATLFGVLIAISLGEGLRGIREEKKAKRMETRLIFELRQILEEAEGPVSNELVAPTWSSIKPTDIPSRIDAKHRVELVSTYIQFNIYNYYVRLKREYYFGADPDKKRLDELDGHILEEKEKLATLARKTLKMVDK